MVLEHGIAVSALAVLPDGRLASAGWDGRIKIWPNDGQGGPAILQHGNSVDVLAVLSDGRLASGGGDGKIKLWPKNGQGGPTTLQHGSAISALAALRDGRLASGGQDGTMKLWPTGGQGEPVTFQHGSPISAFAAFLDGRLASSGEDGTIKLWLIDEDKLIAALCLRAGRNLSKDEWPVTSVPTRLGSRAVATGLPTGAHQIRNRPSTEQQRKYRFSMSALPNRSR